MMRIYIVAFAIVYFVLWGWFSNWSLDEMIWWEGHGYNYNPYPQFARLGIGFLVFIIAVFTVMSNEGKRR